MDEAEVVIFRLCPETGALLKEAASSLYDWCQPVLPEDLCFLRPNGEAAVTTIAHEHEALLTLTSEERSKLLEMIPGLEGNLSPGSIGE